MNVNHVNEPVAQPALCLWPGVLIAAVLLIVRYVIPLVAQDALLYCVFGGLAGGLGVLVWWAFFSRAARWERWGGALLMITALAATPRLLHKSVAAGMMGFMFYIYAIPVLGIAFVAWAALSRKLPAAARRATMAATILAACLGWTLVRTEGMTGGASSDIAWRWSPTLEERLVLEAKLPPAAPTVSPAPAPEAAKQPETKDAAPKPEPEWPGFRGRERNSSLAGVRIETDWTASKPVELWRRPIGPGWSSFAVDGDLLYTQEQRGEDEVVACYSATTGLPVWAHRDHVRFWESNAGAGPRATPTLHKGRIYSFGATGVLNALDAANGAVMWSRNVAADTETKVPGWGFSSSPLVFGDAVFVAASGRMAAYDLATGAPRWTGPPGGESYSSPHLYTNGGADQILLVSTKGVMGFAPADGKVLWKHGWPSDTPIVQPALAPGGDLLVSGGDGGGIRRLAIKPEPAGWTVEERWATLGLKPYFNDYVVHDSHVYGFDRSILSCVSLKDGIRRWKGGRYGYGQMLLLSDQNLLLVISEEGELALVRAEPGQFTEVARIPAIEGKTWNHPVLAGDRLFVRNGGEMAAFRLPRPRR
jgi:outer membrane protein assembly factor BamB